MSDIFIFVIDNVFDGWKVKASITTGSKVILFFGSHLDEKNSIGSELRKREVFRISVNDRYLCVDYYGNNNSEEILKYKFSVVNN